MKLQNKKGWLARDFVISVILFAGVIGLFSLTVVSIANNYGRTDIVDEGFNTRYNQILNLTQANKNMFKSVTSPQGLTLQGTFDIAFGATFTVIQLVFGTLLNFESIPANFISQFTFVDSNVLVIVFNIILTVITITLVFVWLSSISRGRL